MLARTAFFAGFAAALIAPQPAAPERPSPWAACRAWHEHIGDLIDQHRTSGDLDDEALYQAIRLFFDAQASCAAQRFDEGLAAYESISIGRVAHPSLH